MQSRMRKLLCWTALAAGLIRVDLGCATTLWISDDVTQMIYRVAGDGVLLASFRSPANRPSSMAINPTDGTLWSAVEGFSPNFPGGVVNYTRAGTLLAAIPENLYGGVGTEGVAVDFFDDTLWTCDDREPVVAGGPPMIFNIDRNGTVIRSYQSFAFDLNARSPQSIATDPIDGSLWITDNSSNTIYNVATDGHLIKALPVGLFDATIHNAQGISVEEANASLWFSARDTHRIYNVSRAGEPLSSFDSTVYDPNSLNPTGVAVDLSPLVELGDARRFTVFGLGRAMFRMGGAQSAVDGDVGIGPRARQQLAAGTITGTAFLDPTALPSKTGRARIAGGMVREDLAAAVVGATAAAERTAAAEPDRSFDHVRETMVMEVDRRSNVIGVRSIDLAGGETLTLVGNLRSEVVVNVSTRLRLRRGSAILLAGGLKPSRVLFNLVGRRSRVLLTGGSRAAGLILVPHGGISVRGPGTTVDGALITGGKIVIGGGARITFAE